MDSNKYNSVVLADRHQNLLEGIRDLLEGEFKSVVMVADEKSLFETVSKLEPDLVIIDLSLPSSDKMEMISQLSSQLSNLKIIVLSVHEELTVVERLLSLGVNGFVLKRCIATDLMQAIQSVIQGHAYISPVLGVKT